MQKFPELDNVKLMTLNEQQQILSDIFVVVHQLSNHNYLHSAISLVTYFLEKDWYISYLKSLIQSCPNFDQGAYFDFIFIQYLKVENKDDFLYFFSTFPNTQFFMTNFEKFDYSNEEKSLIQNVFSEKSSFLFSFTIEQNEKEKIFSKIGLVPILLKSNIFCDDNSLFIQENFNFLIKYFPNLSENKDQVILSAFFHHIIFSKTNDNFLNLYKKFCLLFKNDVESLLNNMDRNNKLYPIVFSISNPILEEINFNSTLGSF